LEGGAHSEPEAPPSRRPATPGSRELAPPKIFGRANARAGRSASTPPPPPDHKVFLRLFHKEVECRQKSSHSIGDAFPLRRSSAGELADEEFVRARAVSPAPGKPSREVRSDSTVHLHQKRHCQISREF